MSGWLFQFPCEAIYSPNGDCVETTGNVDIDVNEIVAVYPGVDGRTGVLFKNGWVFFVPRPAKELLVELNNLRE